MKKIDLVKKITAEVNVAGEKVNKIINILFETLSKALEDGDSFNQDNFGTFKVVSRKPRKGRNPQTAEIINIPEKKTVKFVISGTLKKKLNEKNPKE